MDVTYYLMYGSKLGKYDNGRYLLYIDNQWVKDEDYVIFGMLNGYDPYEPEGSPYGWGSLSVMDNIEEISEEKALSLMKESK